MTLHVALVGGYHGEVDAIFRLDFKSYSICWLGHIKYCVRLRLRGLLMNWSTCTKWANSRMKEQEIIKWDNIRSSLSHFKWHSDLICYQHLRHLYFIKCFCVQLSFHRNIFFFLYSNFNRFILIKYLNAICNKFNYKQLWEQMEQNKQKWTLILYSSMGGCRNVRT